MLSLSVLLLLLMFYQDGAGVLIETMGHGYAIST